MLIEEHFKETEKLIRRISPIHIWQRLLSDGYYPEQNVLPPCFCSEEFELNSKPYIKEEELRKCFERKNFIWINYPKSLLTSRRFQLQYPLYYHDIVYWLIQDREQILNHLFNEKSKIYSYSFPIPVTKKADIFFSPLRSGRLIYEWIAMAEKDLVIESSKYEFIIRSDITNFYPSVYTHSIAWALHWREESFLDRKEKKLVGNKIDKLMQYSNDSCTNGIPIGSALSDLIAEIILSKIDLNISERLKGEWIDFIATRFKDDYRFLCNSKKDADVILKTLSEELLKFNLLINESKTKILELPDWLYREHDREYHIYSLKNVPKIEFKQFELTLLRALDVHKKFPGTSILEKFLSELLDKKNLLKIKFSEDKIKRKKEISKMLSLLILLKRESEKTLCYVLGIIELLYISYKDEFDFKTELIELIKSEMIKAWENMSTFQMVRYLFFVQYLDLWVEKQWFKDEITNYSILLENPFLRSLCNNKQEIFTESNIKLFKELKNCIKSNLATMLAVFNKDSE